MRFEQLTAISGLTLAFVSSGHSAGIGTLTAAGANSVTWQAPGASSAGAAVTIANGETKIIHAANAVNYVVVSRTAAAALSGAASILVAAGVDPADLLAACESAIRECLRAESEGSGDANLRRATLTSLRAFRAEMISEIATAQGNRPEVASADLTGGPFG